MKEDWPTFGWADWPHHKKPGFSSGVHFINRELVLSTLMNSFNIEVPQRLSWLLSDYSTGSLESLFLRLQSSEQKHQFFCFSGVYGFGDYVDDDIIYRVNKELTEAHLSPADWITANKHPESAGEKRRFWPFLYGFLMDSKSTHQNGSLALSPGESGKVYFIDESNTTAVLFSDDFDSSWPTIQYKPFD